MYAWTIILVIVKVSEEALDDFKLCRVSPDDVII